MEGSLRGSALFRFLILNLRLLHEGYIRAMKGTKFIVFSIHTLSYIIPVILVAPVIQALLVRELTGKEIMKNKAHLMGPRSIANTITVILSPGVGK